MSIWEFLAGFGGTMIGIALATYVLHRPVQPIRVRFACVWCGVDPTKEEHLEECGK